MIKEEYNSQEYIEQTLKEVEEFSRAHTIEDEISSADFDKLDKETQFQITLIFLQKRHNIKLINLQQKNISEIEEEYLRQKHKEEEELLKNHYAGNDTANIDKSLAMISQQSTKLNDIQESSKFGNKKLITVKNFEDVFSIEEETQRKMRGRHKDPFTIHSNFRAWNSFVQSKNC